MKYLFAESLLLYVIGGLGIIAMIHDYNSPPKGKTEKDAKRGMMVASLLVLTGYLVSPNEVSKPSPQVETTKPMTAAVESVAPPAKPEKSRMEIELEQVKAERQQYEAETDKLKADIERLKAELQKAKDADVEKPKEEVSTTVAEALLSAQPPPNPEDQQNPNCALSGKVVSVTDGDTLKLLDAKNQQHTIRLAGIDAPEKAQPFGNAAKKHLGDLVADKQVCTSGSKTDKYGRTVAKVMLDDQDIDLQMVKDGYAWHFKKYEGEQTQEDRESYAAAHDQAKSDTIGLWSEPDPIEPDAWRAGERPQKATVKLAKEPQPDKQIEDTGGACGDKRFCKQMASCTEARHYLNDCGVHRLDADSDGVPCESICGGG